MAGRLDGKVCVITGAGGGMGREGAIVFTGEGAKVCVADIDLALAEETVSFCPDGSAFAISCNVALEEGRIPRGRLLQGRRRDEFGQAVHPVGELVTGSQRPRGDELVVRIMSSADVGLSPDPKNPLNDVSTMNKTMEYMVFGLPVVAFDLRETRVSAGDAAVYVQPNDEQQYAEAIVTLLDDEPRRAQMGKLARERVEQELAWDHQESAYLGVYERVLGQAQARNRAKA